MPSKLQNILELYSDTLNNITKSPEEWISFLMSAANNYKYNFDEQVLIYVQRPDAIACADIETWNTKVKRWVSKGSKGIALVDYNNGIAKLRHVFDISDTYDRYNKPFSLWKVEEKHYNEIIERLEARFGELEVKENLGQSIISSAFNSVDDNLPDYLSELISLKENSFLEELDDLNIEVKLRNLLVNSVSFIIMKRCDIDPFNYFSIDDFRDIVDFNTYDTVTRLGAATSDIAETSLREIAKTVKEIKIFEKNSNYTFVENEEKNYDNNIESNERSGQDANNIYNERGLQYTKSNDTRSERESEYREIFDDEVELHQGKQKRIIYGFKNEERTYKSLKRNREISKNPNRTDNSTIEQVRASNGRNKSNRPNEMGSNDEQFQEFSRRDSDTRIDLQLEELSSVDEQINKIIEAENKENSAFLFTQEMIDKTLQSGSNFSEGKYRIYEYFQKSLSKTENIEFLKKEYGIGGSSAAYSYAEFGQSHDSKGILLYKGFEDKRPELLLKWSDVEKRIAELIFADRYLTSKEMEEYPKWLEEREKAKNLKEIKADLSKRVKEKTLLDSFFEFCIDRDIFDMSNGTPEKLKQDLEKTFTKSEWVKETIDYLNAVLYSVENGDLELETELKYFIDKLETYMLELNKEYVFRLGDTVYIGDEEFEIASIGFMNVQLYDPRFPMFRKRNV